MQLSKERLSNQISILGLSREQESYGVNKCVLNYYNYEGEISGNHYHRINGFYNIFKIIF